MMKFNLKLSITASILSCILCSCATLKPVAPGNNGIEIPQIVQPVSNISIPVTADLRSYFVQAENSVPNKYSDNQQPCQGLRYAYTFTRTPFDISGNNSIVNLKFTGSYGFSVSYCAKCADLFGNGGQCIVPTLSAQCGVGNEPPRRMEIGYQSTISVQPDYHLRSKTILYPDPKPIDRCNVLMGNIDVTNKLIDYIKPPLNALGAQVDSRIGAFTLKPIFDQLWKSISAEFKLGDVGYLSVNPQAVCLSGFNLNGSQLNFSVGLSAKPVVTIASNPQPVKPLPNLTSYVPANGFSIYLDLLEKYDHLNNIVNQQVQGQSVKIAGNTFTVDSVRVYGIGTKMAMTVNFSGTNTGTVYLVGTPTYDAATHELSFPDLSFDLKTKAWMLKVAKWMFNARITDAIRNKATYDFSKFVADNKAKLQSQLSRDLGNNIHSEVTIQNLDIQAIYPTAEKLIIRTLSSGQIKVNVVM